MKGIKSKVITDEETVRMHTNFAEFKNVAVLMASKDIATYSKSDGVLRLHTNTIRSWGILAICRIPNGLLNAGQKYGISVASNSRALTQFIIQSPDSKYHSTYIKKAHWEGNRLMCVVTISEDNLVDGLCIAARFIADNTDYELSDFRIWEIDDATTSSGGATVRFLSAVILNLAYAGRKEAA